MKTIIILFFISIFQFCTPTTVYSQETNHNNNHIIDSLKAELEVAEYDTNFVLLVLDLMDNNGFSSADEAIVFLNKALEISTESDYSLGLRWVSEFLGDAYNSKKEWKTARKYYEESKNLWTKRIEKHKSNNDSLLIAGNSYDVSRLFAKLGEHDSACLFLNNAIEIIILHKDDYVQAPFWCFQLSMISLEQRNYDYAIQYAEKGLEIAFLYPLEEKYVLEFYNLLSYLYGIKQNIEKQMYYQNLAAEIIKKTDISDDPEGMTNIARQLLIANENSKALDLYNKILNKIFSTNNNDLNDTLCFMVAGIYYDIATIYIKYFEKDIGINSEKKQQYVDSAITYTNKSLDFFSLISDNNSDYVVFMKAMNTKRLSTLFPDTGLKIEYANNALELFQEIDDKSEIDKLAMASTCRLLASAYNSLYKIQADKETMDKSKYYLEKAIEIYSELNNPLLLAESYNKLASMYFEFGVKVPADENSAIAIKKSIGLREVALNYYNSLNYETLNNAGISIIYDIADVYQSMASSHFLLGDYAQAQEFAELSIKIFEEAGITHAHLYYQGYILSYDILANTFFNLQNYSKGISVLNECINLLNKLPENDKNTRKINGKLVDVEFYSWLISINENFIEKKESQNIESLKGYYRCLLKSEIITDKIDAYINLIKLSFIQFDLDTILLLSVESVDFIETMINEEPISELDKHFFLYSISMQLLINMTYEFAIILQDYDLAQKFFLSHIQIISNIKELGEALHSWQKANNSFAKYNDAKIFGQEAISLFKESDPRLLNDTSMYNTYAETFHNLAKSFAELELADSAKFYYNASIAYAQKINDELLLGVFHKNTGSYYFSIGEYEKALSYYNMANAYLQYTCHPCLLLTNISISNIMIEQNLLEDADSLLKSTLQLAKESFPNRQSYMYKLDESSGVFASIYSAYGRMYEKMKDYVLAVEYYQKALNEYCNLEANNVSNPEIHDFPVSTNSIIILWQKAACMKLIYNTDKTAENRNNAIETYDLLIDLIDKIRSLLTDDISKLAIGRDYIVIYSEFINLKIEQKNFDDVFMIVEKSKSQVLLTLINNSYALQSLPLNIQKEEKRIREEFLIAQNNLYHKENDIANDIAIGKYFSAKNKYEKHLSMIKNDYPDNYSLRFSSEVISLDSLQNNLDDNQALIEFFIGDSIVTSLYIDNNNFVIHQFNLIENNFDSLLEEYRDAINVTNVIRYSAFQDIAHRLYSILLKPFEEYIKDSTSLIIIPDGLLYNIPFEALVTEPIYNENQTIDKKRINYLIKRNPISYHYSATLWFNTKNREAKKTERPEYVYFTAAPFSGENYSNDISYIPNETDEQQYTYASCSNTNETMKWTGSYSDAIISLSPSKSKSLTYKEATLLRVKSEIGSYRYVNLLTHGCVEDKETAFLLFYDEEAAFPDAKLTIKDVFNLNLNADIVVLAACQSGVGDIVKGEGMMSLARGFLYRGADNIIYGLFPINHKHMSELVYEFYKNNENTNNFSKALQKSKIHLIEKGVNVQDWSSLILLGVD